MPEKQTLEAMLVDAAPRVDADVALQEIHGAVVARRHRRRGRQVGAVIALAVAGGAIMALRPSPATQDLATETRDRPSIAATPETPAETPSQSQPTPSAEPQTASETDLSIRLTINPDSLETSGLELVDIRADQPPTNDAWTSHVIILRNRTDSELVVQQSSSSETLTDQANQASLLVANDNCGYGTINETTAPGCRLVLPAATTLQPGDELELRLHTYNNLAGLTPPTGGEEFQTRLTLTVTNGPTQTEHALEIHLRVG